MLLHHRTVRQTLLCFLVVGCASGPPTTTTIPPQPAPVVLAQAPEPAPPQAQPAPVDTPPTIRRTAIDERVFEPALEFTRRTNLSMYRYHTNRIGNTEGYSAPIIHVRDGGFLVVGTRHPPGRYQVGKSRPIVAKLDADGALVWEHTYPASGFLDYEGASAIELDDGYVVYILSYVHPARGSVARLVRIEQDGGVVWDLRLRGDGHQGTPHPQTLRLIGGQLVLEGHIYKDASETAYGWRGVVSLDGKVVADDVGAANPYD